MALCDMLELLLTMKSSGLVRDIDDLIDNARNSAKELNGKLALLSGDGKTKVPVLGLTGDSILTLKYRGHVTVFKFVDALLALADEVLPP